MLLVVLRKLVFGLGLFKPPRTGFCIPIEFRKEGDLPNPFALGVVEVEAREVGELGDGEGREFTDFEGDGFFEMVDMPA